MGVVRTCVMLGIGVAAALLLHSPATAGAQPSAQAQEQAQIDRLAAKELVDRGIAAQEAADYDQAIEFYNRAFKLVPHPILLFNIGQAHRLAGRPDQAARLYEWYLANDPNGSKSAIAHEILAAFYYSTALTQLKGDQEVEARDNLERVLRHGEGLLDTEYREAQTQLQRLERQLGRIHVICRTKGAEITLNGVALFTGPGSYMGWLKAQTYELTVTEAGHQSDARQITLSAGELVNVDLGLVTLASVSKSNRRWSIWKPWAIITAGGAFGVTGSIFHVLSSKNFRNYDSNFSLLDCALSTGCPDRAVPRSLSNILGKARLQRKMAMGGYIIGSSLITAGIALLYLNLPRSAGKGVDSALQSVVVSPVALERESGFSISVNHKF